MDTKSIPAGEFKQGCLAILDEVETKHFEVVITKRGRPVAKLVPLIDDTEREATILKGLRGRSRMLVSEKEFLAPTLSECDAGVHL